tara:strand:+ start:252 stop:497 length:246 start_codon:yes stop_codon:yes gene_type:complete
MELENVFLRDQLERTRAKLKASEENEKKLKERVQHLLSYAYSEDTSELQGLKAELKKVKRLNKQLKEHINFLYKKCTKLRL